MRVGCGSCSGAELGVRGLVWCGVLFVVLRGIGLVCSVLGGGFCGFGCKRIHGRGRLGWIRFGVRERDGRGIKRGFCGWFYGTGVVGEIYSALYK